VYFSGVANDTVTISGPPFNLKKVLTECAYFTQRRTIPSKLQGLYHNLHLHELYDIYDIVQPSFLHITPSEHSNGMLFSATGTRIEEPDRHHTLKRVVYEILTTPFNWNAIVEAVAENVALCTKQTCEILSFGTTQASSLLSSAIQEKLQIEVQLQDLLTWKLNDCPQDGAQKRLATGKIAIIGMAARVPGANDFEELWQILEKGRDMHRKIPPDRFDINSHVDPLGKKKNTSHTPYGCFIENPGFFDARFFGMSPKEAAQTDPMHRLALITAYEALEMAGFVPNRTPSTRLSRIGTFYGQTSDDWREVNAAQNIGIYLIPGGVRAFAPGRINYFFKFSGPSYSIDTACSSSLAAIQVACTSLLQHECDMAVSGGLNVLTNPDIFAGLSRGGFLSKTGSCKVFDETADGYCRADAAATVVLKRLEDAEADNDHILGVILGTATNHSADAISITHPHAESQAHLYQSILNAAGVDALDISVIEMHGTGTQAGDLNEMRSVTQVFAPESRPRNDPLFLGALKANFGHSEAAAGVTGLVKLLIMLQRKSIPPHVGIKTVMSSRLPQDLSTRKVYIPQKTVEWKSKGKRLAFLNNFSAAGGNTALLLEETQSDLKPSGIDPRPSHVVAISAKSISALKRNANRLISYVKDNVKDDFDHSLLPNLAYTTCARRMHHNYRVAVVLSHIHEMEKELCLAIGGNLGPIPTNPPKMVFIFTGQGGFYPHVGKRLFETSLIFKNAIVKMNEIAQKQASITFLPLITGCKYGMDVWDSEDPVITQVAQLCLQMALADLWRSWGVLPDAVLGHSLGEYAALYVSGVLSMSDAIYLIAQRAKLLQSQCTARTHGMLAVQATEHSVEAVSSDIPYEVACRNSEGAVVLAAPVEDIQKLKVALIAAGLKSIELDVPYAFHSSQVDPILDSFYEVASGINIRSPSIPVISPLLGQVVRGPGIINPVYLRRHLRETVNFGAALNSAVEQGIIDAKSAFLELGPHPICCGMVKSTLPGSSPLYSLHKKQDVWLSISKSIAFLHSAGLKINWTEFHRDFEASHSLLDLPRYSFDEKNYWIDYIGDWCLTKGETNLPQSPQTPLSTRENISLWQRKFKLPTSTVHCVVEEHIDADTIRVKFQSDISEPLFNAAITGHLVNGIALCPSVSPRTYKVSNRRGV
jgi:acyl transferase domain-containing protein